MTSRVFWWKWSANRWLNENFITVCFLLGTGLFVGALIFNMLANN